MDKNKKFRDDRISTLWQPVGILCGYSLTLSGLKKNVQRYFLRLSYKGTRYHGWQVQANAQSVQSVVNQALSTMLRCETHSVGCGRTDTGVHAKDFFAHFDSVAADRLQEADFVYHLNCVLPEDIAVKEIVRVIPEAHARFDARSRTYHYHITHVKNPFLKDRAMFIRNNLDLESMKRGAELLFDYSDFGCFSKNLTQVKTNICKIMEARWEQSGNDLLFSIKADRFLRNMVRAIVGTLLDLGKRKITLHDMRRIIESKNRCEAGSSVPAGGLYLVHIDYPAELFIL
jgi:tRNA pseudouridine38-40 synthase